MRIIVLLTLLSFEVFAQNSRPDTDIDQIRRAMEMRMELHRKMMDQFFKGDPFTGDDEIFKDMESLFEDVLSSSRGGLKDSSKKNFDMAWTESKEGRTLLLSPKSKSPLEINVENGMISIKGKTETDHSVSSFSHTYPVPYDCDETKVKMLQKDGKILMSFPFKAAAKKVEKKVPQDRRPVAPSKGDVSI